MAVLSDRGHRPETDVQAAQNADSAPTAVKTWPQQLSQVFVRSREDKFEVRESRTAGGPSVV